MISVPELKEGVGKTIHEVQYEEGSDHAYLVMTDGSSLEIPVIPEYEDE